MGDDETEKERVEPPPRARSAIARAREAVRKDAAQKQGRWLAGIPVAIAAVMFLLVMPRATEPDDVPVPAVDQRALDAILAADRARAAAARATRLPVDVLAVGTSLRAVNKALAAGDHEAYATSRLELDGRVRAVVERQGGPADLATLRAVETEEFLVELARFEDKGEVTPALDELAGPFLPRLRDAGWVDEHHVVLDDDERRAMYKLVWNTVVGAPPREAALALSLDETRVIYRLYLAHPHPPDSQLEGLQAERAAAQTPAACERYELSARRAAELWRVEKIRMLGVLDPSYPTAYALGVAYYRAGRYETSLDAFRAWIDAHPDGKWTARARNHMKGALAAYGAI